MSKMTLALTAALTVLAVAPASAGICLRKDGSTYHVHGGSVDQLQQLLDKCIKEGGSYAAHRGSFSAPTLAYDGPQAAKAIKILAASGCEGKPDVCKRP